MAEAVWLERDAVTVAGPDATGYLQGQISQDVSGLEVGASAWSWLLAPAGKVDALVRVTHVADGTWLLDVDGGYGDAVVARLNRFKLRTKVEIDRAGWRCLGLRGEGVVAPPGAVAVADAAWPGIQGLDAFGTELVVPDGADMVGPEAYELTRIQAGIPRMGAELTERTIPAETGLVARTVSFTKGCYTGQELVARIDSRGSNVPRRLRGLRAAGPLVAGAELFRDAKAVGRVTSAAATGTGWVGLGYVGRGVDPPAVLAGSDGEPVEVTALSDTP
ncbi:MAG: CAF17-like 4Fe-4S cluster assembly/insertion protein YgfZ [Acidimicrobiales bacterium]